MAAQDSVQAEEQGVTSKRDLAKLPVGDLVRLAESAETAFAAVEYARRNGGKYRSVERMFKRVHEHRALREELGLK